MVVTATSLAHFAGLLADRTRAAMCLALLDGRAWTAGELARHAGVAPSTASEHLDVLVEAGLLTHERQGRHRYLRLTGPDVASLVEELAGVVGRLEQPTSLRAARVAKELAAARTCYDHIAGTLGVALLDALLAARLLDDEHGLSLTPTGRNWFTDLAGPQALTPPKPRPLVRTCLDWTERRHHLGGALGAVLLTQLLQRAWLRTGTQPRALVLTTEGRQGLRDQLHCEFASAQA